MSPFSARTPIPDLIAEEYGNTLILIVGSLAYTSLTFAAKEQPSSCDSINDRLSSVRFQMEYAMERRYSPRKETNSTVLIFHRGMGCVKGLVKNFSSHGMLVDTQGSTLPKGSVVDLAGPASLRIKNKTALPKGLIVHSKDGKVGLMLATESGEIVEMSGERTTISLKNRGIQKAS